MKEEYYTITQRGIPLRIAHSAEEAVLIAKQYRDARILSATPRAAELLREEINKKNDL